MFRKSSYTEIFLNIKIYNFRMNIYEMFKMNDKMLFNKTIMFRALMYLTFLSFVHWGERNVSDKCRSSCEYTIAQNINKIMYHYVLKSYVRRKYVSFLNCLKIVLQLYGIVILDDTWGVSSCYFFQTTKYQPSLVTWVTSLHFLTRHCVTFRSFN